MVDHVPQMYQMQALVAQQIQERAEITVYFKGNRPDASEILALRPCHPGLRQLDLRQPQ
jgi:hypothetical protein